ncbi:MAG: putative sulfate exporter family transporter [Deltaproteobacteria bacterium]|nr:putative sulfate exporter family transporter [Deltaproteobacteria bacterium]
MEEKKSALLSSEDWWSVWVGLGIFLLSLGVLGGVDLLGWGAKFHVWLDPSASVKAISPGYKGLPAPLSVFFTYLFLLGVMAFGARFLGLDLKKFALGFTGIFVISVACWLLGHYAYIAATSDKLKGLGISWSLNLTGEAGFIIALVAGLVVGNFFPRLTAFLGEACRPEWYIKTAIVIMGSGLGVKAAQATGLAGAIIFRGFCAIVEAYLIYWALVYLLARKYFKFSREWAAPLASGVSICGVSAAIATGAAIRARPVVPIMVSSLVVVFAVVELILLPFLAQHFLYHEPLVAGAWMGLAVKTDGAAVASGAIVDSLIRAKSLAVQGIEYKEGWMLMTATTTKMFIDVFIGIWAFVLAIIWCTKVDRKEGEKVSIREIWPRFPKFVLGYAFTFAVLLAVCLSAPDLSKKCLLATEEGTVFRVLFFAMTFFSIGLVSNFKKLWEEGIGRLAAVYLIGLFGFIIWIGLFISWLFFSGIKPPVVQ